MPVGNELKELNLGSGISGSVEAAMLDQKAVFDSMVRKHSSSVKSANKILQHKLYIAASAKLAGPLEYMALAKLHSMIESNRYDLIVLDTPPDTHALDFLRRPNILAGFMENKVMTWLIKPFYLASKLGAGKFFSVGEKLMGGVSKVTGFKALAILSEFLVLMQEVIDGFHKSGESLVKILKDQSTGFFVVATPTSASSRSALNITQQLKKMGYHLNALILNRCLSVENEKTIMNNKEEHFLKDEIKILSRVLARFEGEQKTEREIIEKVSLILPNVFYHKIDELDENIHTTEAMNHFSNVFLQGRE
jgi:anion-transporting  ArsA/GET3 family ATPase